MTDFKRKNLEVLCESVIEEEENIPKMNTFLDDHFYSIVETWDDLIAGSNCFIIHDAGELEKVKEKSPIWYESLKMVDVYSLVLYPLKANGETIGYIWATNFNSANTLSIKAILEVTSFILAAEIANHQLFNRMKELAHRPR